MRGLNRRLLWLIAVSFLLSGKLCLFGADKLSSHKPTAPVQLTAKIVAVDYERQVCIVEIDKRIYLFSIQATKISKRGKALSLKDLITGQSVTLLLSQDKLDLLAIIIGPSGKPSEPAGNDISADHAPALPALAGGSPGSPARPDGIVPQSPLVTTTPTPRANTPPNAHPIGPHPLNRRPDVLPFQ